MKQVVVLLTCVYASGFSQTSVTGSLQSYVNSFIDGIPRSVGGSNYQTPGTSQLSRFGQSLLYMLQGDLRRADSVATTTGYMVVTFTDTTETAPRQYQVLTKNPTSTTHWGMFIVAVAPRRGNLVIQCPHPVHDSQTGKQGIVVFMRTGALAYAVSGTHRCNNMTVSSCSGTTTACTGEDAPYRISDQAHVVNSTFQRATEVLSSFAPQALFVQLHGFAQDSGDPDLIISNGTRWTPAVDPVPALRSNLLAQDSTLTFKVVHLDLSWTKLTAFTNTQGRYLNASPDPCFQNASSVSGRFLHVEQAFAKLRSTEQNWLKMANALAATFPATSTTKESEQTSVARTILLNQNFPNPFNPSTTISISLQERGFATLKVYTVLGEEVRTILSGEVAAGTHYVDFSAAALPSGVYVYRLHAPPHAPISRRMIVIR